MPSLICSSRYTLDSQILRKTAQSLEWETLRLDGRQLPDWFEPPDDQIAIFYTAPHAFEIADQLGRRMLGCSPDWTVNLPAAFLNRELRQTTLADALQTADGMFVKHAVSKAFPAGVYATPALAAATESISPEALVHVGEPVRWTDEYRCFIANGAVATISPYVCAGVVVPDYDSFPQLSAAQEMAVREFAESVLQHPVVDSPPAFVLDVGQIEERGWSVVEWNECWASGIYGCDPVAVLRTLTFGNAPVEEKSGNVWDFARHYRAASPGKRR